jgi:hypothetical protein
VDMWVLDGGVVDGDGKGDVVLEALRRLAV